MKSLTIAVKEFAHSTIPTHGTEKIHHEFTVQVATTEPEFMISSGEFASHVHSIVIRDHDVVKFCVVIAGAGGGSTFSVNDQVVVLLQSLVVIGRIYDHGLFNGPGTVTFHIPPVAVPIFVIGCIFAVGNICQRISQSGRNAELIFTYILHAIISASRFSG